MKKKSAKKTKKNLMLTLHKSKLLNRFKIKLQEVFGVLLSQKPNKLHLKSKLNLLSKKRRLKRLLTLRAKVLPRVIMTMMLKVTKRPKVGVSGATMTTQQTPWMSSRRRRNRLKSRSRP